MDLRLTNKSAFTLIVLIGFMAILMPAAVSAETVHVIKSFPVGEVSGIAVDADGIVWFTQRTGLNLGRLNPDTGSVKLYPIPYRTGARYGGGGNPEAVIVSSTGDVWFSEIPMMDGGGPARIARFHPDTEQFDEYLINPSWWNGYGGSISIGPTGLSEGPDGRIWFNDRAAYPPHIGFIIPSTGSVTIFTALPGYVSAGSLDIAVTSDGKIWYANGLFSGENALYLFDEDSGAFTNMGVSRAFDLAALSTDTAGNLWFTTFSNNLGRVTSDGDVRIYTSTIGGVSSLYLDVDTKGAVWFTDYSRLYRFDPRSETFSGYQLPFSVHLVHVDGQDRVWVGSWNTIALVSANQPPVAHAGTDKIVECAGPSGTTVTLNGSGSSDPDGDALTYAWSWNGGTASGVSPSVTLPLGTHAITLTVDDGKGGTAADTVTISVRDTTPPVTTVRGIAGIAGSNGWYRSDVTITVDSTDSCSGVKEIRSGVDGNAATTPGSTATIPVQGDGSHVVAFGATDNAGNVEQQKTLTIRIDKTAPDANISVNPGLLWPPNHKMVDVGINGGTADGTSGIASVVFTVTDEYGTVQPAVSGFNTTVPLEARREGTDKDGRHYTITAVITDAAGNSTSVSAVAVCPHDMRDKR